MKFVHKVAIASSLLLIIIIAFLGTIQFFTVKSKLQTTIEESIQDIVHGVKNTVSSELGGKKAIASYATSLAQLDPSHQHITDVIRIPEIKQEFLLIGGGYESDGSHFKSDPNWEPGAGWDPRIRPWYVKAKNERQLIITEPYADSATGEILISVATPLIKANEFIGAIFFDLSLSGLSDLVNRVQLFDAGYIFIVSENGVVIAHPDASKNGKNMSAFLPNSRIQVNNIEHPIVDGEEFNLRFAKIPEQDWYIGVLLNEKIAYKAVTDMRNQLIIFSIIALVVSVLVLQFIIKKLLTPLNALNSAIENIATGEGDLTRRLSTDTDQEFAELATGFNLFKENLREQIKLLKSTGDDVLSSMQVSQQGVQDSNAAVSSQLQEIDLLATAMNQMTVNASEVANNALSAAEATKEADNATQTGVHIVEQTTSLIGTLSSRIEQAVANVEVLENATHNIETILQVINEIAEQTNLLALNAAIEAARAGEQGRGFAVVADEVRTLASRTQDSTTEIRAMIDQLQSGVKTVVEAMKLSQGAALETVEQAQSTQQALDRICAAINLINDMNTQIASAAEEQSSVSEEINENTVKIRDISVNVSNYAHQTSESIELQANSIQEQKQILDRFKV